VCKSTQIFDDTKVNEEESFHKMNKNVSVIMVHGSTHDSGARGPGFDPTPKLRMAFSEALISLLSDNRLKNDFHSFVIL
jgi:hypothetical protein